MRIIVTSIFVQDQAKALDFYTNVLGFQIKQNVDMGEFRWVTLVSPENPDGTELLLEPNEHPAAKDFQERLYEDGIPFTMLGVSDVAQEYERLSKHGVTFTVPPSEMDGIKMAVFDDTCGNLIQIIQN